jgi:RHS repeat-associated protein
MNLSRRLQWLGMRALVLAILTGAPLLAQGPEIEAPDDPLTTPEGRAVLGRGFDPTKLYDAGDIDTVNLFNGGLSLRIPIGPSYPQNGGTSFGLNLVYNSSVWDYKSFTTEHITWCNASGNCGQPHDPPEGDPCFQYTQKWPSWTSNAGLGWRLTLGELFKPGRPDYPVAEQAVDGVALNEGNGALWRYDAPDGSSHEFSPVLHLDPGPPGSGPSPLYTNDGSYLRLKCWNWPENCLDDEPIIEMPDGSKHVFERDDDHPGGGEPSRAYRVKSIQDRFGNEITIDYANEGRTWTITDQHDRIIDVRFGTADQIGIPGAFGGRFLQQIEVPGVGNQRLFYDFEYATDLPGNDCGESYPWGETTFWPPQSPGRELKVALLERISLPERSSGTPNGPRASYDFEYQPAEGGAEAACHDDVLLRTATIPTRGRVEWSWDVWDQNHPLKCPEVSNPNETGPRSQGTQTFCLDHREFPVTRQAGVVQRRVLRAPFEVPGQQQWTLHGTWTYEHQLNLDPIFDCRNATNDTLYATTAVVDPLGHRSVHHFSAFTHADHQSSFHLQGWTRAEYGLPINRSQSKLVGGRELFLSSEVYQCDTTAAGRCSCAGQVCTESECEPLQKTYVRYETDAARDPDLQVECNQPAELTPVPAVCRSLNPVRTTESTDFYGPGNSAPVLFTAVERSDYDGLGHFRQTVATADFCANLGPPRGQFCRGDHRVTSTQFNPGRPTLEWVLNDDWPAPERSARWLWTNYGEQVTRDYARDGTLELEEKAVFDFDANNGFLRSKRTRANNLACGAGDCPAGHDVLVEFVSELDGQRSTGNVARETYSGGDGTPLSQGPQHQVRHTYEAGVLESSLMVEPPECGLPGEPPCRRTLLLAQHQIDPDTGLMTRSTDAAGVAVAYQYDAASRLSRMAPDGELATDIGYVVADASTPAAVTLTRGAANDPVTRRTVLFDSFGRVFKDRSLRFNGDESQVLRTYWPGGQLKSESTPGPLGPARGETTYECYDALGRLLEKRYPDHTSTADHKTVFDWQGPGFLVTETLGVARARGGETALTKEERKEFYDSLGRAWLVEERSAGQGAAGFRETLYKFDLHDRPLRVLMSDGPDSTCSPTCQEREFLYDGLGHLRAESHPELSGIVAFGGQTFNVVHDLYDSRGNRGRRRDGRSTLGYAYDFAGRPVKVSDVIRETTLQEFSYADQNRTADGSWAPAPGGADKTAGKLFQARQHQWLSRALGDERPVTVTETFRYQGAGGRLSDYSVRSFGPFNERPGGIPSLRFTSKLAYDTLGQLSRITYPRCNAFDTEHCPAGDPAREVENLYAHGWLTGVKQVGGGGAIYASAITYHPSGLPHQIPHGNGVSVVQAEDPKGRPRPKSIVTQGVLNNQNWASGDYLYDTLGNIYEIGSDRYLYDEVNRLLEARIQSAGPLKVQRYTYDVFANLRSIADDSDTDPGNGEPPPLILAVQASTNRLGPAQATYDATGNVTSAPFLNLDTNGVTWDALGRLTSVRGTGLNRQFLYSAFGERLAAFDSLPPPSVCGSGCLRDTWTVRGPGRKVLRDYTRTLPSGGSPSWSSKDYIYRGGALLASVEGAETRHFHLDHLGSPRLISDQDKTRKAYHVYYPYGREATSRTQDTERLKFTGHERDFQTEGQLANSEADDLDYMHARYYSPWVGRFLSVDRVLGELRSPQSWNRYAYVTGNPLSWVDPDGHDKFDPQHSLLDATLALGIGLHMSTDPKVWAAAAYFAIDTQANDADSLVNRFHDAIRNPTTANDISLATGAGGLAAGVAAVEASGPVAPVTATFLGAVSVGVTLDQAIINHTGNSLGGHLVGNADPGPQGPPIGQPGVNMALQKAHGGLRQLESQLLYHVTGIRGEGTAQDRQITGQYQALINAQRRKIADLEALVRPE